MSELLVAPVIAPLLTAALLVPFTGRRGLQRGISLASAAPLLALALWIAARTGEGGIFVLRIGLWDPRVGVTWVADALTAVMLSLAALVSLAVLIYAPGALRGGREARYYYPLHQLMVAGVHGSFLTGDFFNLFVCFEIMLLASFALISLGGRPTQLRRAFPYVTVNLVVSALFLGGVGAMYGTAGTVNMAEVSRRVAEAPLPPAFWGSMALIVAVFAVKAALAPVFVWLPDAYPEASIPANALFSGMLTKVGVYALFRVSTLLGDHAPAGARGVFLGLAGLTMLVGVLGALGRGTLRGILSFHIVSQIGYMIFALAVFTPLAVAAGIFFIIHQIPVKAALFLAGGVAERVGGSGDLGAVRGMARTHPWVAASFFVAAMSLAGLPPLGGFWGKLTLLIAGYGAGAWAVATVAVVVSFFTLASMLKIWNATFWGAPEGQRRPRLGGNRAMLAAALGLASLSVLTGALAAPVLAYSERAAAQLLAVTPYVDAVLGPRPRGPR